MAGHSSISGQEEVQQTNEQWRQKKDHNQDPSEERVEMQRFTWRIHASRRNKIMCFFHIYSILLSSYDKIYTWWRPQIMWRKLVFPCFFLCFWMEEINWWEVRTESLLSTVFPYFFRVTSILFYLFVSLTTWQRMGLPHKCFSLHHFANGSVGKNHQFHSYCTQLFCSIS